MSLRERNLDRLAPRTFDVLVVGAGINGAVSAAALASKGARVALVDRGDFAGFTSQHSSNLAWGGIKYMENYEIPRVRDLCMSRNELLRSFPSSVREIRFLTTVSRGFRHRPLAVRAGGAVGEDFLALSRRHAVDVDSSAAHLSIFGGKLTDCVNVGDEICEHVQGLGTALPHDGCRWYGEPQGPVRDEYFHRARLMGLDERTAAHASEPLSGRLWRRYGLNAPALRERIDEDPSQADVLIEGTEYVRVEIDLAARREMIVRLDDFLRRRSKIALVMRRDEIRSADGLMEACRMLFGDAAQERIDEYFARNA